MIKALLHLGIILLSGFAYPPLHQTSPHLVRAQITTSYPSYGALPPKNTTLQRHIADIDYIDGILQLHIDDKHRLHYSLLADTLNSVIPLPINFSANVNTTNLEPGAKVKVGIATGINITNAPIINAVDVRVIVNASQTLKEIVATEISSITLFVKRICNTFNKATVGRLRQRYFNQSSAPTVSTLQQYYETCSYGKVSFSPNKNIIVGNISLPCKGVYGNRPYYSDTSCSTQELYGWLNDAIRQAQAQGIDVTKYQRKILILPRRNKCGFLGLAGLGCYGSCIAWINPKNSVEPDIVTIFHEIGHTLGLLHANRNMSWSSFEYGDATDPMGVGGGKTNSMTCHNVANSWKLGWSQPTVGGELDLTLDGQSSPRVLLSGVYYDKWIPPLHKTDKNHVRIRVHSAPSYQLSPFSSLIPAEHVIYVSYRSRRPSPGFDSGLIDELNNQVYVHNYNGTYGRQDPGTTTYFNPTLSLMLDYQPRVVFSMRFLPVMRSVNYWFKNYGYGLNITLVSKNNTGALIRLCKRTKLSESSLQDCTDGLDNDCDGFIDADDPGCRFNHQ